MRPIVSAISSLISQRRCRSTSKVTTSTRAPIALSIAALLPLDDEVAPAVHARPRAGWDHHRVAHALDDRGATERRARADARAGVHLCVHEATRGAEVRLA